MVVPSVRAWRFSLKNWTSKAVPLSQAFAVLSDMMDDENNTTNKKFDA